MSTTNAQNEKLEVLGTERMYLYKEIIDTAATEINNLEEL